MKPYFSKGAEGPTASSAGAGIGLGAQIGPFKLLGVLGEGGYGIVYLAEQERPIRRRVALKIVKPGMDSKQVIARFEAERQALALLDHPNIAQIHDAGTTTEGRPYFAMEYVEGLPITEYCDGEKLSLRKRLRLFLQVCSAVQHAHQKGIIHRDLKPSNILVTAKDDKPLIKVIDFGIAKALAQSLTERTLYTEQGQFIGTPDYMSPEQAEMDARAVDTRSDVYSLGVVLYELLTGVLPFDPDTLRAGGVEHMHAVIREQEPRTPSTRLTTLGGTLAEIAERRRTDPRTLARALRRELEWIPLKAMRKEASRRYQSASELANDIDNYLKGAPLLAGPESVLYCARKFVHRHAGAVAAAAVVAVSLLIGLIVSTTMYFRAETMRSVADDSRQIAQTAQAAEETQRRAAEQERDRAMKAEQEATRRLVDLYQEQGRRCMELGDLDRALVLLTEALKKDNARLSTLLLAEECLRTHPDPNLNTFTSLVPWKGDLPDQDLSFAVSPDRTLIAFVNDGQPVVRIFDTETAEPKIQLQTGKVSSLTFVPGGRYLLTRSQDTPSHHSIGVFDLDSGQQVASIPRANADIDKLMACPSETLPSRGMIERFYDRILLGPDGGWFAFLDVEDSADELESRVLLWDFADKELRASSRYPFDSLLTSLILRTVSSYGHSSGLVGIDCKQICHVWDVPRLTPSEEFHFPIFDGIVSDTRMIVLNRNGSADLFDRSANRRVRRIPRVIAYGFSPDAARFITKKLPEAVVGTVDVNEDTAADIWDAQDGDQVVRLNGTPVENWHFAPNSRFLVTEHDNGEIRVWLSENGKLAFTVPPDAGQEVADISLNSNWLATGDRKTMSVIGVWDLVTGERYQPYALKVFCRDMGAGWTIRETDAVFRCSGRSSEILPRFNPSGSALISCQGLLPLRTDASSTAQIVSMVTARIDLRIENGRIRPASQEEIWQGRLDAFRRANSTRSPAAIDCLLNLTSHAIAQDDPNRASTFLRQYLAMQPIDNVELTARGRDLAKKLSVACFRQGDREERCGRIDAAIDSYKRALSFCRDDPQILHRLAWILATCPEKELRNSDEAVDESRQACNVTGWTNWEHLSTYATACAADGAFTEAVRWQQRANELLPLSEENRWGENFRVRLRLFESRRPYDRKQFYNVSGENLLCWWTPEGGDDGVLRDRSGRGHDAKTVGGVRRLTDKGRTVLEFYGAAAAVQCANAGDLDVWHALSVVAWVKYSPLETRDALWQQAVGRGYSWRLLVTPETHSIVFECAGLEVPAAAPHSRVIGKTSLNDGRWHQIAGVYDGRALAVYVDGRLDGAEEASGFLLVDSEGVALGQGIRYVATWRELMRDVRIYDCALSAEEIAELYEATK